MNLSEPRQSGQDGGSVEPAFHTTKGAKTRNLAGKL
jgi:hypothetical protein